MSDSRPQAELQDIEGDTTTDDFNVTDVVTPYPLVAGNSISEILVRCSADQNNNRRLKISFNQNGQYITLSPGEFIAWSLKGRRKQIDLVAGDALGALVEVVYNTEPPSEG